MSPDPDSPSDKPPPASAGAAWDAYWRRGGTPGHALTEADKGPILDRFWTEALAPEFRRRELPRAADLACGSGAVAGLMMRTAEVAGRTLRVLLCLDRSVAAAREAAGRLAGAARAVAADLSALPFADGAIDLLVSQYGVEYAGDQAFREAARGLAPGGVFIALVHDAEGGVAAECRETCALFQEAVEIAVIPLARAAFAAGFEADRAPGRRAHLAEADRRWRPALKDFERLIAGENDTTAMRFLRQVHRDLRIMHARRRAYAPDEVFRWLDAIENEMIGYRDRMSAMVRAARSEAGMGEIAAIFRDTGCEVDPPRRVLTKPGGASIGWGLRAHRPPSDSAPSG